MDDVSVLIEYRLSLLMLVVLGICFLVAIVKEFFRLLDWWELRRFIKQSEREVDAKLTAAGPDAPTASP